jgi:hypothetical protein
LTLAVEAAKFASCLGCCDVEPEPTVPCCIEVYGSVHENHPRE